MPTFTINAENNITAFASATEAAQAVDSTATNFDSQAALANCNPFFPSSGQGAHDRRPATNVAATTNNHTCAYPTFDHTGTERACIEIAKALMHDSRARREVSSEPYTSGIRNSHVCWRHIIGHARELVDGGHLEREVALSCLHSRLWHTRALAGTESRPSDVG